MASTSAYSKWTERPARCPPACMLVCPGQMTMTLLPMFPMAVTTAPPRPRPNARRSTTETTPQVMPSMVRAERKRLRRSDAQLCRTSSFRRIRHLASFVAQTLDRFHFGGSPRRIHSGGHSDYGQRDKGCDHGSRRDDRRGKEVGKRHDGHQQTNANPEAVTDEATEDSDDGGLRQELIENVRLGGTKGA